MKRYGTFTAVDGIDFDVATARDRVPDLLEFANLSERRHAKTETPSGGMKRRLTIARALINAPELVILDEPTTGLDAQARHAWTSSAPTTPCRRRALLSSSSLMIYGR